MGNSLQIVKLTRLFLFVSAVKTGILKSMGIHLPLEAVSHLSVLLV